MARSIVGLDCLLMAGSIWTGLPLNGREYLLDWIASYW